MAISIRPRAAQAPLPKVEEDIVCWRLNWVKPFPENIYIDYYNFVSQLLYVDNDGYVTFGSYGTDGSTFYVYTYDVNGNIIDVFSTTEPIWIYPALESTWGKNVSQFTATTGSYIVIINGSRFYVFRYGKIVWEWDTSYDGIQNKQLYIIAISRNGKYIASTVGDIDSGVTDSIVLYEGISDTSQCPKPPG